MQATTPNQTRPASQGDETKLNALLDGIEIGYDGITGQIKCERGAIIVAGEKRFSVIRRYGFTPTFGQVESMLIRKGIL